MKVVGEKTKVIAGNQPGLFSSFDRHLVESNCRTSFRPSVISPSVPSAAYSVSSMPYLPQSQPQQGIRRAERIRFDESTPVSLRFPDGRRSSAQLQVVSLTGGLLCLPQPVQPGLIGKLLFLTQNGSVLGEAQMLTPMSWERQPFKFTSLRDDDRDRLNKTIQSRISKVRRENEDRSREREQMEKFRAW